VSLENACNVGLWFQASNEWAEKKFNVVCKRPAMVKISLDHVGSVHNMLMNFRRNNCNILTVTLIMYP
jgi:hypothetical protein